MSTPRVSVAWRGRRRLFGLSTVLLLGVALTLQGGTVRGLGDGVAPAAASRAPALDGSASGGRVIVVLKDQHSRLNLRTQGRLRSALARRDQAPIVASIRAHGGADVTQLVSVNAVAARVSAAEVSRLRSVRSVARVVPDSVLQLEDGSGIPTPSPSPLGTTTVSPANCSSTPVQEPEADADIHASTGDPSSPDMANSVATGTGVVVAIAGMNQLAGNPNFTSSTGRHVVINAASYTTDSGSDESYEDASSVAAQGTVVYQYSKALPLSGVPATCTFSIEGDAPGASLVDSSQITTPPSGSLQLLSRAVRESQVVAQIDAAVVIARADVISESYGGAEARVPAVAHTANDAAVAAGVTVVVSSGDSGVSGTLNPIASDPLVIAAGAVDNFRLVALNDGFGSYVNNNIAALSSGGTAVTNKLVDVVAPGWFGGESACADGKGGCPANYPTEAARGTSEAAPLTAGAAADVIQAYRDTHGGASPTPALIKQILTSTATDVGAPADEQGGGLLDIYAAVKAAQQMPGSTDAQGPGDSPGLVASPSQLDISGSGRSTSNQSVTLYNTSDAPTKVVGTYRSLGPESQIGSTVTENVSAPDPSLLVPPAGATAATPITFAVPAGVDRLDADLIWPDPLNANILQIQLFNPEGALVQESYDDGQPGRVRNGVQAIGSVSNDQHIEVSDPEPGTWTAKILWAGTDEDVSAAPNKPGTYTGPLTFRASGQNWVTSRATSGVTIPANSSVSIPLAIAMPADPGDHPESVQFSAGNGAAASVPVARRTLIPGPVGLFQTLITSAVGRAVGQVDTYNVDVPAGSTGIDVDFNTADASADNPYTFYLINPSGQVVTSTTVPKTVNGQAVAVAALHAANPVAGLWQVDVQLNLTTSGNEFSQTVYGQATVTPASVGNVEVPNGQMFTCPAGLTVNGNVIVDSGGTFSGTGCTVSGFVQANGGAVTLGSATSVGGKVKVSGGALSVAGASVGGDLEVDGGGPVSVSGATVSGSLDLQDLSSTTGGSVCATSVGVDLTVEGSSEPLQLGGSASCAGNTVQGGLTVDANSGQLTIGSGAASSAGTAASGNSAQGKIRVLTNTGSASSTMGGNWAGGSCTLSGDSPAITVPAGSSNYAGGTNRCVTSG